MQRLTAQTERLWLGTPNQRKYGRVANGDSMRTYPKTCYTCKKRYRSVAKNQKFCPPCGRENQLRYAREYARKYREAYFPKKGPASRKGPNNGNWKGGVGIYSCVRKKKRCQMCQSDICEIYYPVTQQELCRACYLTIAPQKQQGIVCAESNPG